MEGGQILLKEHELGRVVSRRGGQCSIDSMGTQTSQNYCT